MKPSVGSICLQQVWEEKLGRRINPVGGNLIIRKWLTSRGIGNGLRKAGEISLKHGCRSNCTVKDLILTNTQGFKTAEEKCFVTDDATPCSCAKLVLDKAGSRRGKIIARRESAVPREFPCR